MKLDLFANEPRENLLPRDGEARYFGPVAPPCHLEALLAGPGWRPDEVRMFGKIIHTSRKVVFFGNREYRYSGVAKPGHAWSPLLLELKALVENLTGARYNACLANLYHSGGEGMGWHSDDEPEIVPRSAIASLSFGAERRFVFRHKQSREKVELLLENGSLLVMAGDCQSHWQHTLPKCRKILTPRVNLTFRLMR